MNTRLNNHADIKNAFHQLSGKLTEKEVLDNEAKIIMFRFLSIIDAKREELGWTRKDLAKNIGTSPSFVSQLFRGDKLINMTTLATIQKVMGIEFEISQKMTYEGRIISYTPKSGEIDVWIYKNFDKSENASCEFMPLAV